MFNKIKGEKREKSKEKIEYKKAEHLVSAIMKVSIKMNKSLANDEMQYPMFKACNIPHVCL